MPTIMINSIIQLFDLNTLLSFPLQALDSQIEAIRLFGIKLINPQDFWELLLRFGFNLIVTFIIIRGIYFSKNRRKDYFFIYFVMNIVVFLLCFMLENVTLEMGFALGLFALFGIIRYRTDPIPIKEMTYLFLVVGVAILNALANKKISYAELLFTNLAIVLITWYLEKIWMKKQLETLIITYEKIDLVHVSKKNELMQDISERTGLDVKDVSIMKLSYLRDTARISVSYKPKS